MLDLDKMYPRIAFRSEVEYTTTPWFVKHLWQRGKINVIAGFEKAGKSRFMQWILAEALMKAQTTGQLQVDWQPKKVLYLAGEEMPDEVNARMLNYIAKQNEGEQLALPIDFMIAPGMQLELPHYREWLERTLIEGEYDLLIGDPLRRLHAENENDNSAMAKILNDFRRWTNMLGVTMLIVHHTPKLSEEADLERAATYLRGATDFAAILDTLTVVSRRSYAADAKVQVKRMGRMEPVPDLFLFHNENTYGWKEGSK